MVSLSGTWSNNLSAVVVKIYKICSGENFELELMGRYNFFSRGLRFFGGDLGSTNCFEVVFGVTVF